jgi:hypothetical protein
MHISASLLAFAALYEAIQVNAGTMDAHVGLTKRLHRSALRQSAGLAKDLRTAFNGLLSDPPPERKLTRRSNAKHVCVPKSSAAGNNNNSTTATFSMSSGASTATKSQVASTTRLSSASPTPSSDFKIAQSYVRDILGILGRIYVYLSTFYRLAMISGPSGTFLLMEIRPEALLTTWTKLPP